MKNYDEQIKIQERLKQHGIFFSSLVPSPYADMIEQLLNKLDTKVVKEDGNGLQSNETNPGKSEDEPVHATETAAGSSTGSTATTNAATTEPAEPAEPTA